MSRNKKIIPDLRFPEFEKDGEWKIIEVGDVFNVTRGNVLAMNLVQENKSEEFPYPVFSSQTKNNGLAGFYKEYLYENAITWTTDGANAGDVNYRIGKFYCTNVCGVLLNEEGLANLCIAELINSVSKKHVSYIGNPKLMNGVMSKIKIPIPSITEQQKIASCLSSLDEVIEAHSQRLELLKDHKKGLMQNLFPQESEKVPKFRFPEFEKDGAWVEKKLGTVAEIITGNTPSTHKSEYYDGEIMFISPADINGDRYITQTKTTLTELGFSKTRPLKANSVLFVCIGSTIGKIAQNKFECATNQQINSLMPFKEYSSEFLYSALENSASQISKLAGIQAVPIINKSQFSSVKLFFPKIQEQQKIASCLSALDDLITAEADKIEQLQQHKKGLMQGLFPKIEN
ncbi:MAG: restriction endonuclease subunit S [Flavobacteriales bacterium]